MKFKTGIFLALKYLFLYKRRYLFLFIALAFGFGIITLITSEKDGVYRAVYQSAQGHYSGDLVVLGLDARLSTPNHMNKATIDKVLQAAKRAKLGAGAEVMRTVVSSANPDDKVVFYNGAAVSLMHVLGVDWKAEKSYFDSLNYTALAQSDNPFRCIDHDDTIILSKPAADILKVRPGDKILLEIKTSRGQINTAYFKVSAIMNDLSIFGYYKAFISRRTLNALIGFPPDECSVIGFYFAGAESNPKYAEQKRVALYNELRRMKVDVAPLPKTRNEYENGRIGGAGDKVDLITVPVYLTEVSDVLDSLNILTYFLYIMMLVIVFVSAMVTYNLIIHERGKDIGTMRALGFYEADVRFILFAEVLAAGTLALIFGFILALLGAAITAHISFSGISGFDMFLKDGRMRPLFRAGGVVLNIIAVYCALLVAIVPATFRTSRTGLPKLLAGGVKE